MALLRSSDIDANDIIARQRLMMALVTAVSQTGKVLGVHKAPAPERILAARSYASAVAGTVGIKVFNVTGDAMLYGAAFAIDATAEKYKSTTTAVSIVHSTGVVIESR